MRSKSFGQHGATVRLYTRGASKRCWLWWRDGGQEHRTALDHSDWNAGCQAAATLALELQTLAGARRRGILTVRDLFDRYLAEVTPTKKPLTQREDRRRIDIWTAFLGAERDVEAVDHSTLSRFSSSRASLSIPGRKLSSNISLRTVGADVSFLHAVLNWAERLRDSTGRPLLSRNPIRGIHRPNTKNPRRPVASYDRFETLRPHCDPVDHQQLFGGFMDLVEGLGWRVSALCGLWVSDISLGTAPDYPYGRIRKRAENDKEDVDMWVPLTAELRGVCANLLLRRRGVGDVPLFPAKRGTGPWTKDHASAMLERAEKLAGLEPMVGGKFHPYRRKWVTERKHLPDADVAAAGGWKSVQTLQQCYQKADAATMLAVVASPIKLREVK